MHLSRYFSVYLKTPSSADEWHKIAYEFGKQWNFPNALGTIHGKHVVIQKPENGGSYYYNYKHTHPVILVAIAGRNYECLCA